jgi:hypothetical protein
VLIARAKGQLGNQMFIYSAAFRSRREGEKLLLLGFDELRRAFGGLFGIHLRVPNYASRKKSVERVVRFLRVLASCRIIGIVDSPSGLRDLTRVAGLLPLALFDGGYCQDEELSPVEPLLSLRNQRLVRDSSRMRSLIPEVFDRKDPVCFVHVRMGDYLNWPTKENPAALPQSFYEEQIQRVAAEYPSTRFLIFSDDIEFCRSSFSTIPRLRIVDADAVTAWLAMSMCEFGILSASTFSWSAARVANHESGGGLFLAPRYWTFWTKRLWPENSPRHSSVLTWVDLGI